MDRGLGGCIGVWTKGVMEGGMGGDMYQGGGEQWKGAWMGWVMDGLLTVLAVQWSMNEWRVMAPDDTQSMGP